MILLSAPLKFQSWQLSFKSPWRRVSVCSPLTSQSGEGKGRRTHRCKGSCVRDKTKALFLQNTSFQTFCVKAHKLFWSVTIALNDQVPPRKGSFQPIQKSLNSGMVCLNSLLARSKLDIHIRRSMGKNWRPAVQMHSETISCPSTKGRRERATFLCI